MASASPIARARRSTELSLVVMAGFITGGAYMLASLGEFARIPARIVPFLLVLLGILIGAHLAVRWFARGADPTLLPLAALLHGVGYVMITRLDERLAGLQTTWSILAVAAFAATLIVIQRATDLARYRWLLLATGLTLLVLPLLPGLGLEVNGARIWVNLGPVNFQPGEFAKLALAVFFAAYLAERRELIAASTWKVGPFHLPEPQYLLPIAGAWGAAVVVMVGLNDLGSSLLFFALFVVMMWVATERASYLLLGLVLFAGAAFVSWQMFTKVQTRVDTWLDPWADPLDTGYQVVQSLYGLTDGGLTGSGLGLGSPNTVPYAESDFIFASIGEELGLFGASAVLIAYVLFIGAGLRTALRNDNTFEKLLAVGLTTIMGVQAFIIMGGVIKLVPVTGITLPFVSYGGSSLLSNYVLLALLMRLSDSAARRRRELPDDPTPGERWRAWRLRRRGGQLPGIVDATDTIPQVQARAAATSSPTPGVGAPGASAAASWSAGDRPHPVANSRLGTPATPGASAAAS